MLGEPLVLGVIVGALIGWAAQLDIKKILFLGVTMGAVMELIPRITALFIDGLKPISEKTQELVKTKFNGKKVHIGMSPALVIYHPTTPGSICDSDSGYPGYRSLPARQPILASGFVGRYVLPLPNDSAVYKR